MHIAEPGGIARGVFAAVGNGGRRGGGRCSCRPRVCARRPGRVSAATGEASRGDRGRSKTGRGVRGGPGDLSSPSGNLSAATGGGPRRAGVFAEARETYPRRPGTCPRQPAGVLSAATGRGSVRGNRRGSAEADRFAASPTYSCRPGAVLAARGSPAYSRRSMTSSM